MSKSPSSNFIIKQSGLDLKLKFFNKTYAENFSRMDFYSRIIHSLAPNKDRIWEVKDRLKVEIKGWPKNVKWQRMAE